MSDTNENGPRLTSRPVGAVSEETSLLDAEKYNLPQGDQQGGAAVSDHITLPRELVFRAVKVLSPMAYDTWPKERNEVVKALRDRLAAPQPEPVDVGLLEYRGNSVAYIYQKMWSYKENNMAAWAALGDKGIIADGKTTLAEMIAKRTTLAAPPPQPDALALAERLASGRLAIIEQLTGELEALRRDAVHPGYIIGSHWLETAYSRVCAGEAEADVLRDCGWERVTDAEALRREAERYRYLRNRDPAEVLSKEGKDAGCWIDCEDDMAGLQLLTGDDADTAIDAALQEDKT